jgi:hypothetical protein
MLKSKSQGFCVERIIADINKQEAIRYSLCALCLDFSSAGWARHQNRASVVTNFLVHKQTSCISFFKGYPQRAELTMGAQLSDEIDLLVPLW